MSEFSIVTYGGGEVLRHTFNGIVMVLSFGAGGFGSSLLNVIGVVGVVWTMALGYHRATFQPGLSWFGWYLLATTVLLTPKTTLYIKDPVSMNNVPYRVDNVPFVLGALAGTINEMMQGLTKNMESVFSLPDYLPYHQTGSIFASRLMVR